MTISEDELPLIEGEDGQKRKPRVGIDLLTTGQVAKEVGVTTRTVERWITKPSNALPALRVTGEKLRSMGYAGNLYTSSTEDNIYYLVRKADLKLISTIRSYPKGTKRPNRTRKATLPKPGTTN